MKVLITGICGFAGSTLALRLRASKSNCEIFGVDNLVRAGSELNRRKLQAAGFKVFHGDLRVAEDVEALPAADWVLDAAANPSVLAGTGGSGTSSRQLMQHNLNTWRVYRDRFYRPARTFRDELRKRLGIRNANSEPWIPALDRALLVGAKPIAQAADYLAGLARRLK